MNCVDLRQDANDVPLETEDGLCSVCQKLNFNWSWSCPECVSHSTFLSQEAHFHIGTARRLLDKPFCLGCRLILSSLEIPRPVPLAIMEREIQFASGFITYWDDNLENGFFCGRGVVDGAYFEATLIDPRITFPNSTKIGRIVRDGPRNVEQPPARSTSSNQKNNKEIVELRGRTISPIIDISTIKDWMRACEVHHSCCKTLPPPSSNGNSFRLIDVQEQRIISSTNPEEYIALSYVWGSSTLAVLTKDTLPQYSVKWGLKTAKLPQTIVDCIQLVKDIGERYLWVDSLCIVQDDYDDKLKQLRTMDNVYRNAALVVVAAAGENAHAGLCGVKDFTRCEWQRRETIHGIPYMTAQPPLCRVLERTIWNSRGWTFQEAMLARRLLFFTEEQVYWSCRHANWREDMDWEISQGASLSHPLDSFWETQVNQCRTARYCRDVMDFTKREIREQSDAIWAFMGILKLHLSRFPGGFIWGHPLERLDATLIWDACSGDHQRTAQYPLNFNNSIQSVEYPSWSWLSTNAPVEFADICGDRIISEVNWHEPLLFEDLTGSTITNRTAKLDNQAERVFSGSKGDVTKYGLLQCTAETVELLVVRQTSKVNQTSQSPEKSKQENLLSPLSKERVEATVYLPSGESTGTLFVQKKFFDGSDQQLGQFILLSSYAKNEADEICIELPGGLDCGNISHRHACKHIQSYNLMLVERRGDIVYRLALHFVKSELWQKVKTRKERFILG